MTRRSLIASGALGATTVWAGQEKASDESFRYRWATIEALFARAKKSRREQTIPFSAYEAMIGMLRAEEMLIFRQAAEHKFQWIEEDNYWRRGKLKFPSSLETEVRLVAEGKDPALERP